MCSEYVRRFPRQVFFCLSQRALPIAEEEKVFHPSDLPSAPKRLACPGLLSRALLRVSLKQKGFVPTSTSHKTVSSFHNNKRHTWPPAGRFSVTLKPVSVLRARDERRNGGGRAPLRRGRFPYVPVEDDITTLCPTQK